MDFALLDVIFDGSCLRVRVEERESKGHTALIETIEGFEPFYGRALLM